MTFQVGRRLNRSGFTGGFNSCETGVMTTQTSVKYSPEVCTRAVRNILKHWGDYLRLDVGRHCLCGARDQHFHPAHRELAGERVEKRD